MSPFHVPNTVSGYLGAGQHEVTVDSVQEGTSSGGHPQLVVEFKDAKGATIRDWVVVIDSTMWRVQKLWEACGLPWPEAGGQIDENDLLDKRLLITVAPQEYGGQVRDKVTDYAPVVGSDIPFDGMDVPVAAPAAKSAVNDDDEIPFLWRPVESWRPETRHNPFA